MHGDPADDVAAVPTRTVDRMINLVGAELNVEHRAHQSVHHDRAEFMFQIHGLPAGRMA